jgi:hypothetical protein
MALWSIRTREELGSAVVLAPERYDPRRDRLAGSIALCSVPLTAVARIVRKVISPGRKGDQSRRLVVLDTSDAREGIVVGGGYAVPQGELGSAKKELSARQVIISRLRPYLRQVAYVDPEIRGWIEGTSLVCSTEFFVLESTTPESIAFLVPYLLSAPVQEVLAASQEGGHHPRVREEAMLGLPVPDDLIARRAEISMQVEKSVRLYRQSERVIAGLVAEMASTPPVPALATVSGR